MWPLPNERFRLATENEWLPDHRNPFICPLRNERFPVATDPFCAHSNMNGFLSPAGSQEPFHLRALSFGNPFMWPLPHERFRLATENEWLPDHRNPFICPLKNERFPVATDPFCAHSNMTVSCPLLGHRNPFICEPFHLGTLSCGQCQMKGFVWLLKMNGFQITGTLSFVH